MLFNVCITEEKKNTRNIIVYILDIFIPHAQLYIIADCSLSMNHPVYIYIYSLSGEHINLSYRRVHILCIRQQYVAGHGCACAQFQPSNNKIPGGQCNENPQEKQTSHTHRDQIIYLYHHTRKEQFILDVCVQLYCYDISLAIGYNITLRRAFFFVLL